MDPTQPAPMLFTAAIDDDEEAARAGLYGLLARLWLAPPDDALRERLQAVAASAHPTDALLGAPWQALLAASSSTAQSDAAAEYDALFLGVGRPELLLYGSFYLSGFLNEKPLAALRDDLAALGLARERDRGETEDHVACVFEVMHYLIAGDDPSVCTLEQQRRFFRAHVQSWVEPMCEAVQAHSRAALWREVAAFTRAFVQVEAQAFDLLD